MVSTQELASGILVAGTSSDAGKSLLVTGICRALARQGVSVAPFKAQNMSNNSMVCADGAEIGRAQYLQAQAAGVVAESAMNPVLLKPGSDRRAHVVLRGRPAGVLEAGEYATGRAHLAEAAYAAYTELAQRFQVIIAEGAGSPAEINLRAGDYVNAGLAQRFGLPMVVVGDIDRGGVFASLYGTWALLDEADRKLITAFVINKFRGDLSVLEPGMDELTRMTDIPVAGVLPWLPDLGLDAEDSLALRNGGGWGWDPGTLRVAVVRLPRVSNTTDVDALAAEPGVDVLVTSDPGVVADADLAVLPGSRATVSDLRWLRDRGLADAVALRARRGAPVLGICGGYQMLGATIADDLETRSGLEPGLDLLPVRITFRSDKTLGTPIGSWRGAPVAGYEIHHGVAEIIGAAEPFLGGCRVGSVWGTMWHGAFENDGFRRTWLAQVADGTGSTWQPDTGAGPYRSRRETMIDTLADAVEHHLDLELIMKGTGVLGGYPPGIERSTQVTGR